MQVSRSVYTEVSSQGAVGEHAGQYASVAIDRSAGNSCVEESLPEDGRDDLGRQLLQPFDGDHHPRFPIVVLGAPGRILLVLGLGPLAVLQCLAGWPEELPQTPNVAGRSLALAGLSPVLTEALQEGANGRTGGLGDEIDLLRCGILIADSPGLSRVAGLQRSCDRFTADVVLDPPDAAAFENTGHGFAPFAIVFAMAHPFGSPRVEVSVGTISYSFGLFGA